MYFTLELNGKREMVKARKGISIGQVTQQAFGPTDKDARVVIATNHRDTALGALCKCWPLFDEHKEAHYGSA
jgi:hypothetical protein